MCIISTLISVLKIIDEMGFLFVFAFEDLESDVYSTLTAISVQTGHISDAQYPPVAWGTVLSSVLLED